MGGYSKHCPCKPHELLDWTPCSGLPSTLSYNSTKRPGEPASFWGCWKNRCHPDLGPQQGEVRVMSLEIQSACGCRTGNCYCLSPSRHLVLSGPPRTCMPAGIPEAAGTLTSGAQTASRSEKLPSHSQCICLKTGENLVFALSKRFQS